MKHKNIKTFPILTTERLTLRQLAETDVNEPFLLRADAIINKFLERQPSRTLKETLEFIKKIKSNNLTYWAIALNENQKLIGTICLFDISEEQNKGEIGYELLTEYQGKGFMKEAAKKIIDYAFQTLEIKTIVAYTHKDNSSSTNLLTKLDFKQTYNKEQINPNLIVFQLDSTN